MAARDKMSASTGIILPFRPRQPAPEQAQPEPETEVATRGENDAETYAFAAAILREGFRLAVVHARVTVPKLNRAGPLPKR